MEKTTDKTPSKNVLYIECKKKQSGIIYYSYTMHNEEYKPNIEEDKAMQTIVSGFKSFMMLLNDIDCNDYEISIKCTKNID